METAMKITRLPWKSFGVEVASFDARRVTAEDAQVIRDQVYANKLVVFRDQTVTNDEYVAFARAIGRPQVYFQDNYHHPDHPEIFVSSNVPENGKKVGVSGTGRYWHTDYQFFTEPLPFTMLQPKVLPSTKRETSYIDMEFVLSELPASLRQHVENKRAIHDGKWRYKIAASDIDRSIADIFAEAAKVAPPITHPAIIKHPVSGKQLLYMSSGFTTGIEGLSYEASQHVLKELFDFVERADHVYTHPWQERDILLWDNRSLVHRAGDTPKGERSASYRIGIYDNQPFYSNAA
jgi:taurine dioxygenase